MINFNKTILDTNPYDWKYKLVKIYDYVCEKFEQGLQYECQRHSNNSEPEFTDQEIATIYLFVMQHQKIFKKKDIHRYARLFDELVSQLK